eukprot:gb/GEZN01006748.1/.p1 GENE.gb/GEZN01006748.1/~~gb/GEZN01006748.1/.p1  ORF type:complete len:441 (+),score=81.47 gb/GEZN01006748.1/:131-1324(+)
MLKKLITSEGDTESEAVLKIKEDSIYSLGKIYVSQGNTEKLSSLLVEIRPFFQSLPKARTAKIVRTLIEQMGEPNIPIPFQISVCEESIEWCVTEKRRFLKQRIQTRLCHLLYKAGKFKEALALVSKLIKEVKKFDDKLLLIEIHLIGSHVHHALQNLPKAKGELTAARTNANATNCPPSLQAKIDKQAGTLCADEQDFKTGFSYFFEAFEGYNTINDKAEAVLALKYMLLCKIMMDNPEEVQAIASGKSGLKYAGPQIETIRDVAKAYKKRSIQDFENVYKQHPKELGEDPLIKRHLGDLKEKMLEANLIKLIEPFSRVQIPHVAKLIDLPVTLVEAKLSEMILDKKLNGILDQGSGDLIVFDHVAADKTYENALGTVKELSNVVDRLYTKTKRLT